MPNITQFFRARFFSYTCSFPVNSPLIQSLFIRLLLPGRRSLYAPIFPLFKRPSRNFSITPAMAMESSAVNL